ncbi:MAG: 2-amino-4-hydroxy-6-hydroxymethyldihydropteridine diphosphokinase [Acidimicrobiales bacterium]
MTTRRAFLGLGSNLGDRVGRLREAVAALPDVVAVSPVYETAPVGGRRQARYLNAVVQLDTAHSPRQLLELGRGLEDRSGRVREERFGPRTLDIDVLLVGDLAVDEPDLVVPHPRMWQRRFVLAPLADLDPEAVPGHILDDSKGEVCRLDIDLGLSLGLGLPPAVGLPPVAG